MTNDEKMAHNIVKEISTIPNLLEYEAMTLCATKMAECKDEQFKEEKKRWIESAVDFISKRFYIGINNRVTSKEDYYSLTELIRDFEQTMKGV